MPEHQMTEHDRIFLQEILHRRCTELGVSADSFVGQELAKRLVALRRQGVSDEQELVQDLPCP
jgi:hypothetical protein